MLLGINALNHDASLALVDSDGIAFAAHAERYSRIKNDRHLNQSIVEDMLGYGKPNQIVWADNPMLKTLRKLYSGERPLFDGILSHLKNVGLGNIPVKYVRHHEAHAAMGFYTSGFFEASILVMDAIGEWDTTSIWHGNGPHLKKIDSISYPHSFGLFYTAMTKAIGLKPNEEEYILMGMAALGKPIHIKEIMTDLFETFAPPYLTLRQNLHKGVGDYVQKKNWETEDVAASVQAIAEQYILGCARYLKHEFNLPNLVLVGGVALNCVANGKLRDKGWYRDIWVPPNPGDAGLSLGATLAVLRTQIPFDTANLGTNIDRTVDIPALIDTIESEGMAGLANGRAEFGPRALGNRSLLADPRGHDVKDRVNTVKKREPFRPFAPIILAEHAAEHFDNVKHDQRFMQWTNTCLHPDEYPAICHIDGTSRIQTVVADGSVIRQVLEAWYERTGCPMLLNTSLNVKGEPLVNTWQDANRFQQLNNVQVF